MSDGQQTEAPERFELTYDDAVDQVHRLVNEHARRGPKCTCGWTTSPMLDREHRRHLAESLTTWVLMVAAHHVGFAVAEAREADHIRIEALTNQLEDCQHHLLST